MRAWLFPLLVALGRCVELCLPHGIAEDGRKFIRNSEGEEIAIELLAFDWPSAELETIIAKILIEEVLGYRAFVSDYRPLSVLDVTLPLSGCLDADCNRTNFRDVGHVALESWIGAYGADYRAFAKQHPTKVPEDLGSIGFVGEEALYVAKGVAMSAYQDSGIALEFYKSYNPSFNNAKHYFDSLAALPIDEVQPCNMTGTMMTDPAFMNPYAQWTGDLDGLIEVDGGYHAYCPDGYFWIAPACRHNTSECIPVLSSRFGWLVDTFMAWSTAYGLPTAIGILYTSQQNQAQFNNRPVLSYWFRPDARVARLDPQPVVFPSHRASEWALGNKRTAALGSYVAKLVSRSLRLQAFTVHEMLKQFQVELEEVQQLLLQVVEGDSIPTVACQWVNSNRPRWLTWLPVDTNCLPGFGVVDARGMYVATREAAVGCSLCSAGNFSYSLVDSYGQTYRCGSCSAGHYQAHYGETVCSQCEAGRFASSRGLSACEACQLGSFANASGMTECQPCGNSEQWTTSRLLTIHGEQRWIEVEAASDDSFCRCSVGWFLDDGVCRRCSEGAVCPGSNDVELLPGFYSSSEDPGSVFRCFGDASRCPGGRPGTCAFGRDASSVTCGACLPGLRPNGSTCSSCSGGDYALFVLVGFLVFGGTGLIHLVVLKQNQSIVNKQSGLLNASLYATQLVVCLQLVIVIQKIDITWDEPFVMIIEALSFLSLESVFQSLNAISCVTRMSSTLRFLMQTLAVPTAFLAAPVVIHLTVVLFWRRDGLQLHLLCETLGSLSVLFFIVLCTAVVEPFQCQSHPNGLSTMQSSKVTLCNFRGSHFDMCLMGGLLSLLPSSFLAFCSWVILAEFPKRLRAVDVRFTRACSFLVLRFRPGFEGFCIFTLVRNALFALAPVLPVPNASLLTIHVLICLNMLLVSYFKPWRSSVASCTDLLSNAVFLIILFQGSFFVTGVDRRASMVICTIFLAGIIAALAILSIFAVGRHLLMLRTKKFHYFLSHHKQAAGNLARLMKLELQQRGFAVFLDTDNLNDLTQLFVTLSRNVESLLVLASPQVLTRKWCIAEIVTARLRGLQTTLLMLPKFHLPSVEFIDAYEGAVPDIAELASYGFGIADITDTLRWLRTIKAVSVSPKFVGEELTQVVGLLTGGRKSRQTVSFSSDFDSDCLILANLEDMEAVASAHVLRHFISPHVFITCSMLPKVLSTSDRLKNRPTDLSSPRPMFLVLLCTPGCLTAPCMIEWMLQAYRASSSCHVLPVIASDGFQVPQSTDAFEEIAEHPNVRKGRTADMYTSALKAIFMQIAVHFLPQSNSESGLELRARQIVARLDKDSTANMSSLLDLSWFPSLHLGSFGTDRSDWSSFPSEQAPVDADAVDEDLQPMPIEEDDLVERIF